MQQVSWERTQLFPTNTGITVHCVGTDKEGMNAASLPSPRTSLGTHVLLGMGCSEQERKRRWPPAGKSREGKMEALRLLSFLQAALILKAMT